MRFLQGFPALFVETTILPIPMTCPIVTSATNGDERPPAMRAPPSKRRVLSLAPASERRRAHFHAALCWKLGFHDATPFMLASTICSLVVRVVLYDLPRPLPTRPARLPMGSPDMVHRSRSHQMCCLPRPHRHRHLHPHPRRKRGNRCRPSQAPPLRNEQSPPPPPPPMRRCADHPVISSLVSG